MLPVSLARPTVLLGDFVNRVPCSLHDLLRWRHREYFVGTTFSEGERPRVASCTSSDALVPSSDALASACVWFWGCAWVPSPKTWPALTPWIGTVCGNVWICVAASLHFCRLCAAVVCAGPASALVQVHILQPVKASGGDNKSQSVVSTKDFQLFSPV